MSRNVIKHSLNFATLACIVNSSVFVTNKLNDNEYLNMLSEKISLNETQSYTDESKETDMKLDNINQILVQKKNEKTFSNDISNVSENSNAEKKLSYITGKLKDKRIELNSKKEKEDFIKISESKNLQKANPKKSKNIEETKHKIFQNKLNCTKEPKKEAGNIITGYATAYTAKPGARTANGRSPVAGIDCAMNKKYMGRKIKAKVNNKEYILTVTDHGKAVNSNCGTILDIYMNSYNECMTFGRQPVSVQFIG